ncbi:MAG TPA: deoxyribonuclease V [Phycisphaerae bacterium]|nr:deoxyribonuclease V [Phycisphaerae bacterium]HRY67688.1 deoxyribonuclease V [Phycisphaerae bacterium]HSA25075.1 deoxyribonuclease V [Phycisphaerae bacterium]
MKIPSPIHRWSMTPKAAVRLQQRLAQRVRIEPLLADVRIVAGVDVAFSPDGRHALAGVVLYDLRASCVTETQLAWRPTRFPYVPGLLSFREAPAALAAIRKLRQEPDVFLLDAQGMAHPRRLGLASHLGLLLDRPTIGCAKSRLCGQHDDPPAAAGRSAHLLDDHEVIGAVLRTRPHVKPLYVSAGHRVTLDDAIHVVMACVTRFRLPEPTRHAHMLVTRHRTDTPPRLFRQHDSDRQADS